MDTEEGNGAAVSATTATEASSIAPSFEGGSTTPPTGVVLGINLLAINNATSSPGPHGGGVRVGEAHTSSGDAESIASGASRNMDESASEEGLCERDDSRRAGSSSSRSVGSRRSRDRSNSDHSSSSGGSGRSTRQRRSGGGGGRSRRDRDRSRDDGGRGGSLSPRQWERERGGNGHGGGRNGSPSRRRERDRGDGSPRETPEPSKVLHVRNVGYPVVQSDLVSLLSCFGQVEKIKMFSGQALVQLPSISVAKATMRHYDEDEEPKIGSKRVYLNYSRSRSIETRDGDSLAVSAAAAAGNLNSNGNGGGGGGGGGNSGLDVARALNAARGLDGAGAGNPIQDTPSPYAHLIMEDHAKLLGLATYYLQTYGIPGGEGAILNINQREEMAERQRQAITAAAALNGINGHGHHGGGMGGWNGNAAAAATAVAVEASRHSRGMSGGGGGGMYSSYGARPRSDVRR